MTGLIVAIVVIIVIAVLFSILFLVFKNIKSKSGSVYTKAIKKQLRQVPDQKRLFFKPDSDIYKTKSNQLFCVYPLYSQYIENLKNNFIINDYNNVAIDSIRCSLSKRVKQITQPKGGYLPTSNFQIINFKDEYTVTKYIDHDKDVFLKFINLIVSSISQYLYTNDLTNSFKLAIRGFFEYINNYKKFSVRYFNDDNLVDLFIDFESKLKSVEEFDLDGNYKTNSKIIKNLFVVLQFAELYQSNYEPYKLWKKNYDKAELVFNLGTEIPDYICKNIIIFIKRTIAFYNNLYKVEFGEILYNSELISSGSCDFISHETIWKLQISSMPFQYNPNIDETILKLIICYLMITNDNHYNHDNYLFIDNIGIFNPYNNSCFKADNIIELIKPRYIKEIKDEIIGFNWKPSWGFRIEEQKELVRIANNIVNNEDRYVMFYSKYNYKLKNKITQINDGLKKYFEKDKEEE